jgi:hypothetical protein
MVSVLCLETERETGATRHGATEGGGASGTGHGATEEGGASGTGHEANEEEDLYLWLFVADRSAFPDLSETDTALEKVGDLMTVAWVEGDKVYLLADDGDERSLRAFR